MNAYKFLSAGAVGRFTGFAWPAPLDGAPGGWVEVTAGLAHCESGIHACRIEDLPHWLDDELWAVELVGEVEHHGHQLLAQRGRLLDRVDGWNRDVARELAEDCTWRARDLAREALARAGMTIEAEAIGRASTPDELVRAAHSALRSLDPDRDGRTVRIVEAALTAAEHVLDSRGRPDAVRYCALSAYASTVASDAAIAGGYAAERARQAAWLARRLELSGTAV